MRHVPQVRSGSHRCFDVADPEAHRPTAERYLHGDQDPFSRRRSGRNPARPGAGNSAVRRPRYEHFNIGVRQPAHDHFEPRDRRVRESGSDELGYRVVIQSDFGRGALPFLSHGPQHYPMLKRRRQTAVTFA
jgi:hypothetical protein